jgi:hypothetical protein
MQERLTCFTAIYFVCNTQCKVSYFDSKGIFDLTTVLFLLVDVIKSVINSIISSGGRNKICHRIRFPRPFGFVSPV